LTCSPEVLLRIGLLYLDIAAQEKTVDNVLELLRKDQLDENVPLEGLEKSVGVLQGMLATHLPNFQPEPSLLLRECCRALQAASDSFFTDASALTALLSASHLQILLQIKIILLNTQGHTKYLKLTQILMNYINLTGKGEQHRDVVEGHECCR